MGSSTFAIVLSSLTLGVVAWVAWRMPTSEPAAPDTALGARLTALEEKTAAIAAQQTEIKETVARVDRRVASISTRVADAALAGPATGVGGGGAGAPGAPTAGPGASAEAIGEAVAAKLGGRLEEIATRERSRAPDGQWKPPIEELAKELGVDEAKRAEIARVFDDGRDAVCALLETRRIDGGSMLDDLASDLRDGGDPGAAMQNLFRRILVEKVPNTDRTYFAEVIGIKDRVESELARRLDQGTMEKLRALHVDLLDVKTGHDPVGLAIQQRLQQQ